MTTTQPAGAQSPRCDAFETINGVRIILQPRGGIPDWPAFARALERELSTVKSAMATLIANQEEVERELSAANKQVDVLRSACDDATRVAQSAHAALAAAQKESAINMENFKVTNRAYVDMDERRLKAEAALAEVQRENERICTLHKGLMANADERAERAESALAAAERDAARYQWLRANEGTDDGGIFVIDAACDHCDYIGMEVLDAAIDSALSSTGEGSGG